MATSLSPIERLKALFDTGIWHEHVRSFLGDDLLVICAVRFTCRAWTAQFGPANATFWRHLILSHFEIDTEGDGYEEMFMQRIKVSYELFLQSLFDSNYFEFDDEEGEEDRFQEFLSTHSKSIAFKDRFQEIEYEELLWSRWKSIVRKNRFQELLSTHLKTIALKRWKHLRVCFRPVQYGFLEAIQKGLQSIDK